MVYAVAIRGDEILATPHDRGLGAYWGLPGECVSPGDPIGTSAELAVLEQTNLDVSAGRSNKFQTQ
jgi:ADP-ribose pyrophosphatase YjhB (NUDIX family)